MNVNDSIKFFGQAPLIDLENAFCRMLPRCWASLMMSAVLDWRNANSFNERKGVTHKICNKVSFVCKVLISELAQPLIALCAAVETLVYGILCLKSYLLNEIMRTHLLKSSVFTLLWTPAVFCFFNLFCSNPQSDEYLLQKDLKKIKAVFEDINDSFS